MPKTRTITDIRRELVAESEGCHQRSRHYLAAMKLPTSTHADFDAYEGLATAGAYAWAMAAILRVIDEGKPEAVASIIEAAVADGTDWLEDANNDLDGAPGGTP